MTESRRLDYAALNSVQRYTQWAVFRIIPGGLGVERADIISQTQDFFAQLESAGTVVVRGIYDISSIRAEADYMIWWHAENIEDIQKAYNDFRRTTVLGQVSEVFWTGTAVHRPAEFNKSTFHPSSWGKTRVRGSPCTPLFGPMIGTSWTIRTVAASLLNMGVQGEIFLMFAPTRSHHFRWGITSGSSLLKGRI